MLTKSLRPALPALLPLLLIAASAGGWATVTVEDLPDYLVAGQPVTLTFTVRQHGVEPISGLQPRVEAEAGRREAGAAATSVQGAGRYAAILTLPEAGDWTISIHHGFGRGKVTLAPLTAVAAGASPARQLAEPERGRRLFVAKGCVTCHVNREAGAGDASLSMGPDLTGRRFPAEYLGRFLADPSIAARGGREVKMPNLHLKPGEIASLVAFLNAERVGALDR